MTREKAIKWLKIEASYIEEDIGHGKEILEAYDMAIKALEREPCEDCISRQAVIDLKTIAPIAPVMNGEAVHYEEVVFVRDLKELPSITPQPKIGRWEWVQYDSNPNIGNWHCSECRTIIPHMPEETDNTPIYKWCPMCGAKMEVSE